MLMQIADRRADLEAQVGDVGNRQPPRPRVDHVIDPLATDGLEDQRGPGAATQLVGPDAGWGSQVEQQLALTRSPPGRSRLPARGPDHLRDAAAVAVDAPGVVDVQALTATQVRQHLVARGEAFPFPKQSVARAGGRDHAARSAPAGRSAASPLERWWWCW